jgi:hypothetical protein
VGFARLVVALSGLAFLAIGVPSLVVPGATVARVGVSLLGALADNDVRAVYGGVQTAVGLFLLLGARRGALLRPLLLQQLTFGGLVAARAVSWMAAGWPGALGLALHGAEGVGLAAGFAAWRRTR